MATCLGEIGAVDHGKLDAAHAAGRTLDFGVEHELLDPATGAKIIGQLLYRALLSAQTVTVQDCAAYVKNRRCVQIVTRCWSAPSNAAMIAGV